MKNVYTLNPAIFLFNQFLNSKIINEKPKKKKMKKTKLNTKIEI